MNTIVFVLMVWAGHTTIPSLEFTSEKKCNEAAQAMYTEMDKHISFGHPVMPWCMRIEK
jgi:hypothetical protein